MNDSTTDLLAYYAGPGVMTDPGAYASLYEGLPHDLASLVQIVQNNLLHVFWAERYGVTLPEERQATLNVRPVARKLALLNAQDPRPLEAPRAPDERQVGNCRDFSLLLCSLLRFQGVPARARSGFGVYFLPDHYEDHWVCEYWNAAQERWVIVDAQLDALQQRVLELPFDPLDVPGDQFWVAGKAWQACRERREDPEKFGIFDMHGLWFIRGNVVRDFLALNKLEILPWDGGWGFLKEGDFQAHPEAFEGTIFDRAAALTLAGNGAFSEIRGFYETEPRWQVPEPILVEWLEAGIREG